MCRGCGTLGAGHDAYPSAAGRMLAVRRILDCRRVPSVCRRIVVLLVVALWAPAGRRAASPGRRRPAVPGPVRRGSSRRLQRLRASDGSLEPLSPSPQTSGSERRSRAHGRERHRRRSATGTTASSATAATLPRTGPRRAPRCCWPAPCCCSSASACACAAPPDGLRQPQTTDGAAATEAVGAALAATLRPATSSSSRASWGRGRRRSCAAPPRARASTGPVTSPTFTIGAPLRGGRVPVSHLDLYRLDGLADEDPALLADYLDARRDRLRRVAGAVAERPAASAIAARVRLEHAGRRSRGGSPSR